MFDSRSNLRVFTTETRNKFDVMYYTRHPFKKLKEDIRIFIYDIFYGANSPFE